MSSTTPPALPDPADRNEQTASDGDDLLALLGTQLADAVLAPAAEPPPVASDPPLAWQPSSTQPPLRWSPPPGALPQRPRRNDAPSAPAWTWSPQHAPGDAAPTPQQPSTGAAPVPVVPVAASSPSTPVAAVPAAVAAAVAAGVASTGPHTSDAIDSFRLADAWWDPASRVPERPGMVGTVHAAGPGVWTELLRAHPAGFAVIALIVGIVVGAALALL